MVDGDFGCVVVGGVKMMFGNVVDFDVVYGHSCFGAEE